MMLDDSKQICGGDFILQLKENANMRGFCGHKNVRVVKSLGQLTVQVFNGRAHECLRGISIVSEDKGVFGWGFDEVISIVSMDRSRVFWRNSAFFTAA